MKIIKYLTVIFIFFLLNTSKSFSLIEVDITRGNLNPLPISVSPLTIYSNSNQALQKTLKKKNIGSEISKVVENNLQTSGLFNPLSKDAFLQSIRRDYQVGKIAIAYTVWSKKRGGGKLIVKEVFKLIKKTHHLNRLITLSPLTEMARKFHLSNGAVQIQVNETTQNFEYEKV